MIKNSFIFYKNFYDAAQQLTDEQRLAFYDALTLYAFEGQEPTDPLIMALFSLARAGIDKANERYEKAIAGGKKYRDDIDDEVIRQLRNEGVTIKEIAENFGVHENTIKYRLNGQTKDKQRTNKVQTKDKQRTNKVQTIDKQQTNKQKLNDNDNVNDNVNVNDNKSSCSCCTDTFVQIVQREPSQIESNKLMALNSLYGTDQLKKALEITALNNKSSLNYTEGVLKKLQRNRSLVGDGTDYNDIYKH